MRRILLAAAIVMASAIAMASVGTVSFVNNTVPAAGVLLDGSTNALTPDVPGNKIFAR